MKYYITKYALTVGIEVVDGSYKNIDYIDYKDGYTLDNAFNNTENFVSVGYGRLIKNKEIFDDKDNAEKNFEERRNKKIASLKKQISKLEELTVKYEAVV